MFVRERERARVFVCACTCTLLDTVVEGFSQIDDTFIFSMHFDFGKKTVLKRLYYSLFIGFSDHKIISIKFLCCIELLSLIQNKCTFHKKMETFHVHYSCSFQG